MNKNHSVKFTSSIQQTPTHYRHKDIHSIMWKTKDGWNRMSPTGTVTDCTRISHSPDSRPTDFEPLYGDLRIDISFG